MRRFVRAVAVLAILRAAFAPAGTIRVGAAHIGAAGSPAAPAAGAITFSDWEFPDTLNPFQTGESVSQDIDAALFAQLVTFDAQGRVVPDMLVNVPTLHNHEIRDGGKTIILRLKPHLDWSSGVEITDRDIRFGWQAAMDPVSGPACRGTCDDIISISLRGRYEAILHLRAAYAPLLATGLPLPLPHSWPRLGGTPHAAALALYQNTTWTFENRSYWTDGPYQVTDFANNDHVTLTAMPHYHIHPGPFAHTLLFRFAPTKQTLLAAAASGAADVTADYNVTDLAPLAQQDRYKLLVTPSSETETVVFNVLDAAYGGHPNPLKDARVRQALALATDRAGLLQKAFGVSPDLVSRLVAYTPLVATPQLSQPYADRSIRGAWDPLARRYLPYGASALQDSRALLAAAGYPSGLDLDLNLVETPQTLAEAQTLQSEWAMIGVKVHVAPINFPCDPFSCPDPIQAGHFEVTLQRASSGPDPEALGPSLSPASICRLKWTDCGTGYADHWGANVAGIEDPVIEHAMRQGAAVVNPAQRAVAYRRVQEELIKQGYWVPLYYQPRVVTAAPDLQGVTDPPFGPYTWNVYRWRLGA